MACVDRVYVPREFPQDETVLVAELLVADGDAVEAGQCVAVLEFSKASVELESPAAGYVRLFCREGQELAVGALVAEIYESGQEGSGQADQTRQSVPELPGVGAGGALVRKPGEGYFSVRAEAAIREHGLDAGDYAHLGLVRARDVSPPDRPAEGAGRAESLEAEPVALSRSKRAEIRSIGAGQNAYASSVEVLVPRPGTSDQAALAGLRSRFVPVILKGVCILLKHYPALNAWYEDGAMRRHSGVNLGYALDLGQGLRCVALGDLEGETPEAVSDTIMAMVRKYLRNRLALADLSGATFTVSDLSGEQVAGFIPLINARQGAILGISSPDAQGMTRLVLRFDHRLAEGRLAARFLNALKNYLVSYENEPSDR
jgi:2-oxoglutarate dehydrogenase E2 component (dihydrolipoamide succinyltransferase)